MVSEKYQNQASLQDSSDDDDHHHHHTDQEEEEETLSFCDLPIYDDSFKWEEDFSAGRENDNDFFEFFGDDDCLKFPAAKSPNNNTADKKKGIVFCGKIIPYKGQTIGTVNNNNNHRNPPLKPRWYFYAFGIVRLRTEIELKDMKTRQGQRLRKNNNNNNNNKRTTLMFSSFGGHDGGTEKTTNEKVSYRRTSKVRTLWGLLRAFGCRRSQLVVESVVKPARSSGA